MFPHIPLIASANLAALKKPGSDQIGSDRIDRIRSDRIDRIDQTGSIRPDRSDRIDQTGSIRPDPSDRIDQTGSIRPDRKKLIGPDWTGSEHGSDPRLDRGSDYKVLISRSSSKGKRLWVSKSNMADKTSYRSYFPATAARFVKKTVPIRTFLN